VGQKTGLFLDQRENRRRVGELSMGRRVVNLFGYNGGFSLYAALGGAVRVETVDLAGPALEDAKENFRLNGINTKAHAFIKADVFSWEISGKAGLVICDPPSLTRNKKSDEVAIRAYRDLNARVAPMVTKTGLLATASCTARLSFAQWQGAVESGISKSGRWAWLEKAGAGPDHPYAVGHPDGEYLKFAIATKI
jgi:23S rRNA (cytosine1962-C5)-methyltransferase